MALMNLSRRAPSQLPDGAYDVRGWEVRTELDGEKVGKVDDMLLDDDDRPRYLDVDLGVFRKHVLLPLSVAHADASEQVVWIEQLDRERLREVPEYDHKLEGLSPEYEERLVQEYRALANRVDVVEEAGVPRLARLKDLGDYKVAKGVTDPRGWKVVGGDGNPIGKVQELIVDTAGMTTRYLDCEVEEKKLELEPLNRHILIPAERVRLDRGHKQVIVDGVFGRDMKGYPVYQGLPLDSSAERAIASLFSRSRAVEARAPEGGVSRFFGVRSRPLEETVAPVRARGRPEPESILDGEKLPDNVRIRISGDDIIIEKQRGSNDDG